MVTGSAPVPSPWTGRWVTSRLGVRLRTTGSLVGVALDDLVGLALRRNPRRAHLLVSTVLGKHVPADPRLVLGAGRLLGLLVGEALSGSGDGSHATHRTRGAGGAWDGALEGVLAGALAGVPGAAAALLAFTATGAEQAGARVTVLGFAETATGLGHAVAEALGAPYLHSTRRPVPGAAPLGRFEEEHSHATGHLLLPEDPVLLCGGEALVLVDDELSTGRTVLNTVEALHALAPRERYVVAALVDLRSAGDRAATAAAARRLGTRIDVVALATGTVDLPPDVLADGARLVAEQDAVASGRPARPGVDPSVPLAPVVDLGAAGWPHGAREGGRHGFWPEHTTTLDAAVGVTAARIVKHLRSAPPLAGRGGSSPSRVLVLGSEELMYAPQRLAAAVADALESSGVVVHTSSTTRSPVLAVDADGYAVRTAIRFRAADPPPGGGTGPEEVRCAYNVAPGAAPRGRRYDDVVLVVDDAADPAALSAPDGLLHALAGVCGRVGTVTLPSHRPTPVGAPHRTGDPAGARETP